MSQNLASIDVGEDTPDPILHRFSGTTTRLKNCCSRIEFLTSSQEGRGIEDDIWEIITDTDIAILSYDIFDTLLLRNHKPEARRYLELSQLVLDLLRDADPKNEKLKFMTADDVCEARAIGMNVTYRTRPLVQGCREGLIWDVIDVQRMLLGLNSNVEPLFLKAEIRYEAENLALNPVLMKIAHRFRDRGGKVILISDMYLPAETIEKIIGELVDELPYDHLFCSADVVISKRSGKIFPKIENDLSISGDKFLHLGDSWIGDVRCPREAGWNALYFPVSDQERLQRKRELAEFISEMDEKGIETRQWAKV